MIDYNKAKLYQESMDFYAELTQEISIYSHLVSNIEKNHTMGFKQETFEDTVNSICSATHTPNVIHSILTQQKNKLHIINEFLNTSCIRMNNHRENTIRHLSKITRNQQLQSALGASLGTHIDDLQQCVIKLNLLIQTGEEHTPIISKQIIYLENKIANLPNQNNSMQTSKHAPKTIILFNKSVEKCLTQIAEFKTKFNSLLDEYKKEFNQKQFLQTIDTYALHAEQKNKDAFVILENLNSALIKFEQTRINLEKDLQINLQKARKTMNTFDVSYPEQSTRQNKILEQIINYLAYHITKAKKFKEVIAEQQKILQELSDTIPAIPHTKNLLLPFEIKSMTQFNFQLHYFRGEICTIVDPYLEYYDADKFNEWIDNLWQQYKAIPPQNQKTWLQTIKNPIATIMTQLVQIENDVILLTKKMEEYKPRAVEDLNQLYRLNAEPRFTKPFEKKLSELGDYLDDCKSTLDTIEQQKELLQEFIVATTPSLYPSDTVTKFCMRLNDFGKRFSSSNEIYSYNFRPEQFSATMEFFWQQLALSRTKDSQQSGLIRTQLLNAPVLKLMRELDFFENDLISLYTEMTTYGPTAQKQLELLHSDKVPIKFTNTLTEGIIRLNCLIKNCALAINVIREQRSLLQEITKIIPPESAELMQAKELVQNIHNGKIVDYTPFVEVLAEALQLQANGDINGMIKVLTTPVETVNTTYNAPSL